MESTPTLCIIAALAPAIVFAGTILRRDSARPEPHRWLLAAAALGLIAALGAYAIETSMPLVDSSASLGAAFYSAFVTAGLVEESLKLIMLCMLAARCRHFDEYFDGIVYAVCIGMGFAGLENVFYLYGSDEWISTGISRALLAVPAHGFFAIIMGSFFALGFFDRTNRTRYMALALIVPMAVHGVYDFLCFSIAVDPELSLIILIAFIATFRWMRRFARERLASTLSLDNTASTPAPD